VSFGGTTRTGETRHHPANKRAANVLKLARGWLGDHMGGASEDKESAERGHVGRTCAEEESRVE
jgi:hypothetical protein